MHTWHAIPLKNRLFESPRESPQILWVTTGRRFRFDGGGQLFFPPKRTEDHAQMIADLKAIADMLRSCVNDYKNHDTNRRRDQIVLDLLRTYFLLHDCIEEAKQLVHEAGSNPIRTIKDMVASDAESTLQRWETILDRQTRRLFTLQDYIFGQHHLTVINPEVQNKMKELVGNKLSRTTSLHGIGAALYFRQIFKRANSVEDLVPYVILSIGSESEYLDIEKTKHEISELETSLSQFRSVVERLLSDDEITRLADEARKDTLYDSTDDSDR